MDVEGILLVVLVTLVGQGATFAPLVRAIGLRADAADQARLRNRAIAALRTHLENRLARYRGRLDSLEHAEEGVPLDPQYEAAARISRSVTAAEREELLRMRDVGRLPDAGLRVLERELDLQENLLPSDRRPELAGTNPGRADVEQCVGARRPREAQAMGGLQPRMRAGDRDRQRVVEQLGKHLGDGRLTVAEFDERIVRAHAAVYLDELPALTADLPWQSTPRRHPPGWAPSAAVVLVVAVLLAWSIVAAVLYGGPPILAFLLLVLFLRHRRWSRRW